MRMSGWWSSLSAFERLFWYFALPFTLLFIFRLVAALTGLGGTDDDGDGADSADFSEDESFLEGFRLFTLQNFIIFFTGFGWAGIYAVNAGFSHALTVLFAFIVGLFLMVAVAGIFYMITRLAESGNIDISRAVNATGRVYIPIPPKRTGVGQIQIALQGSLREIAAVTEGKLLPTGTSVRVVAIVDHDTLLVEKSES
jgi:hypothetical protein